MGPERGKGLVLHSSEAAHMLCPLPSRIRLELWAARRRGMFCAVHCFAWFLGCSKEGCCYLPIWQLIPWGQDLFPTSLSHSRVHAAQVWTQSRSLLKAGRKPACTEHLLCTRCRARTGAFLSPSPQHCEIGSSSPLHRCGNRGSRKSICPEWHS